MVILEIKISYYMILGKIFNRIRSNMIHDMKTTDVSFNRPSKFIKFEFIKMQRFS